MAQFEIVREEIQVPEFDGWLKVTTKGHAYTNQDMEVEVYFDEVSVEGSDDDCKPIVVPIELADRVAKKVCRDIEAKFEPDPDNVADERPWRGFRF